MQACLSGDARRACPSSCQPINPSCGVFSPMKPPSHSWQGATVCTPGFHLGFRPSNKPAANAGCSCPCSVAVAVVTTIASSRSPAHLHRKSATQTCTCLSISRSFPPTVSCSLHRPFPWAWAGISSTHAFLILLQASGLPSDSEHPSLTICVHTFHHGLILPQTSIFSLNQSVHFRSTCVAFHCHCLPSSIKPDRRPCLERTQPPLIILLHQKNAPPKTPGISLPQNP
jgi:hypothetical protein